MKGALHVVLRVVVAGAGFGLLLWMFALVMRPSPPAVYTTAQIAEAEAAREPEVTPDNPPCLYREVDYFQGPDAPWYPKGEPTVLQPLVAAGKLPPVAERVGPEPCVYEGVEGTGKYGGTWVRVGTTDQDAVAIFGHRLSYTGLVRFSLQGYPLVPHVARSFEASEDYRTFTFMLRRGMRWSDGHPFTADDILYWWECEANDKEMSADVPLIMQVGGQAGKVEKINDYEVRITFPKPNGLFLPRLATYAGRNLVATPAHYLRPYHPVHGDRDRIDAVRREQVLTTDRAAYSFVKRETNPDHPRLWPWICRSNKPNPPFTYVRNPYYFMVDTQGNQLPYVDRLHMEVKSSEMIAVSAANGEITMQARHMTTGAYSLLMSERKRGGYEVLHWYDGNRSRSVLSPNLNRNTEYEDPDDRREAENKYALLNDVRFRQALSLAINRQDIIDTAYSGQAEPAQNAPGPKSYFHEPSLYKSFVEYDPQRARELLDEIGLVNRDAEGFRTFPDGSKMTFYVNLAQGISESFGTMQFIIEDWADVGVRAMMRIKSRQLFVQEKLAREHDFTAWGGNGEYYPVLEPRYFVPMSDGSNYALGFATWYQRGGLQGDPRATGPGCIEPPAGHPLRRAMELYEQVNATGETAEQRELFREILKIAARNVWTISICTPPPAIVVVKNGFRNVPRNVITSWDFETPGNAGIETYYFDEPTDTPGGQQLVQRAVLAKETEETGSVGRLVLWLVLAVPVLLLVMAAFRHPYVARRLVIMVPTLLIISVVVFVVIQLPPGSYVESRRIVLQQTGDEADLAEMRRLEERFHLNDPIPVQYARWLGLYWFAGFNSEDSGLLQGNLGRSMETDRLVNEIVGDRILLTVLISLGSILFTWAIAIPAGIYSAVRQYSVGDYVLTFFGFIGMCVPAFLSALILMYVAKEVLGVHVSGLFSAQFGAQPKWDIPKVLDLLKHIWVPVLVLGVGGTAGMIRVMRANLLDELKKPYVITAWAKGVRPMKLLLKYPVRMALNPFISGIGHLFPQLVSGGAIVAMVLSLPTVGPLMLSALMNEDMYLAGSMLMVLSLLGVFGTLVSDLLLLWLDPRIRLKGGSR